MITILAVDDMPENLRLLRKLLAPQGFLVLEASNGEQALALAAAAMPDIILVDLRLGQGMTGYELARRLRELPGGTAAVLAALSGGAVLEDEALSRETGFDDFILKPFDFGALAGRLKGLLDIKAASGGTAPAP